MSECEPTITDDQIREIAARFPTDALLQVYCKVALDTPRECYLVKSSRLTLAWLVVDLGARSST